MNPYTVLGVSPMATEQEVRKAYRRLCLECHPDRNPDDPRAEERFKEVSVAYGILSSQEKRQVFDMGVEGLDMDVQETIRTFVRSFGDFINRYSMDGEESVPEEPPPQKKARPRPAKKIKCTKCNDRGFQILRQGATEFKTPCRSCSTST